ncbi:MAG: [FeFe] hydrogenase H-cluster radical SAM maturase HydG [Proteobacteria bacterium]|nr:[FeFe] hydrogenase H-cluster radical SAM maturase HydG [Pseudomonadota bacterium]
MPFTNIRMNGTEPMQTLSDTMHLNDSAISELLDAGAPDAAAVTAVLATAKAAKGLSIEEAATLLRVTDPGLLNSIYETAASVKQALFGSRVVLFAPLYLSNHCNNGCLYCGFRSSNSSLERKSLSPDEVVNEARTLEGMGFKRILMVTGEDPHSWFDNTIKSVEAVYKETGIRVIHVNAPTMEVDAFKELKRAGVGVYQAFQETYHRETYATMHPTGPKRDYDYRLSAMDRAMEAGFGDVGIGPLLGLYDFRFEVLASISHSMHLFRRFGAHAHTISVPRLRPAAGSGLDTVPVPVTDEQMKLTVAVLRLAVPTAGVVVSTRESAELRTALLHTGASQLSAASRTDPGGYTPNGGPEKESKESKKTLEQFSTDDHRPLVDVMASIAKEGFVPSLCTTCYRTGRTGSDFFDTTIEGGMETRCRANAILSLKEYVVEHPKNENGTMNGLFDTAISNSIDEIADEKIKKGVKEKLIAIERGKRDLFY